MTGRAPGRLSAALFPLGVVALVAGCGGGSVVSHAGGTSYIPPASGNGKTKTVSLTFTIPLPKKKAAVGTRPKYIASNTQSLSVQYAPAGAPSPWPSPLVLSVPTPAATPVSVSANLQVPVGNESFVIGAYDGPVTAGNVSGYQLSATAWNATPVPIAADGAQTLTISLLPVPDTVQIDGTQQEQFIPLVHQRGAKTFPVSVSGAVDADGNAIVPPFASRLQFVAGERTSGSACSIGRHPAQLVRSTVAGRRHTQGTAPATDVTFSGPSDFSTPITATFPADAAVGGTFHLSVVPGDPVSGTGNIDTAYGCSVPANDHFGPANLHVDPEFYIFAQTNASVAVITGHGNVDNGSVPMPASQAKNSPVSVGPSPGPMVGAAPFANGVDIGCADGATAMIADSGFGQLDFITVDATGTALAKSPQPLSWSSNGVILGVSAPSCTGYAFGSAGYMNSVSLANGSPYAVSQSATQASGFSSLYSGAFLNDGNFYASVQTGGVGIGYLYMVPPASPGSFSQQPAPGSGSSVYAFTASAASPDASRLYYSWSDGTNYHVSYCTVPCSSLPPPPAQDQVLEPYFNSITSLAVSPDGQWLFAMDPNAHHLYEIATSAFSNPVTPYDTTGDEGGNSIVALAVSPDSQTLFGLVNGGYMGSSGSIVDYDIATFPSHGPWNYYAPYGLSSTATSFAIAP